MFDNTEKITENTIIENSDYLSKVAALLIHYPDYFWELMAAPERDYYPKCIQSAVLRGVSRSHKSLVFGTRRFGKTEEINLKNAIHRCVTRPGTHDILFAPTETRCVEIYKQPLLQIERNYPLIRNEYVNGKWAYDNSDYIEIEFVNGSTLSTVGTKKGTGGQTKYNASGEELSREDTNWANLNAQMMPVISGHRYLKGKRVQETDNCWNYYTNCASTMSELADLHKRLRVAQLKEEDNIFIFGLDWQFLIKSGLQNINYVKDIRAQLTATQYIQEMCARHTGANDKAILSEYALKRNQTVDIAEFEADKSKEGIKYIFGYDVAISLYDENNEKQRKRVQKEGAMSCLTVYKETELPASHKLRKLYKYKRELVYIKSFKNVNEFEQALFIKKMVAAFNPYMLVVDYNGLGRAIVGQLTQDIGDGNPPYGCFNRPELTKFPTVHNIIWAMYDGSIEREMINGISVDTKTADMITNFVTMIQNDIVGFLIDRQNGIVKFKTKNKIPMFDTSRDIEIQEPYENTKELFDEVLNLKEEHDSRGLKVVQMFKLVQKDRYSSSNYALFISRKFEIVEIEKERMYDVTNNEKPVEKKKRTSNRAKFLY